MCNVCNGFLINNRPAEMLEFLVILQVKQGVEMRVDGPGWEDTLEMGAATHSSIFAPLVAQLVKNLPALQETWV